MHSAHKPTRSLLSSLFYYAFAQQWGLYRLYVNTGSLSCTYSFLFLGNFKSTTTFLTLTLSGSNHLLCSEFIGLARLNVVKNVISGPTGKKAFFSNSYVVYILSSIICKAGTSSYFSALLTNVCPPARSLILFFRTAKSSYYTGVQFLRRSWYYYTYQDQTCRHLRPYYQSTFLLYLISWTSRSEPFDCKFVILSYKLLRPFELIRPPIL